jgi:DNA invertase Pin-like site-specific DNA recombinase
MTTIVDIYCRSATDDSETHAKLENQEAACRAYCQENGLIVGMVHHEVASGATYQEREHLSLLRSRYRAQLIEGVVVTYVHRLARNLDLLFALLEEMERYQITLHCVNANIEDTTAIRFLRAQK